MLTMIGTPTGSTVELNWLPPLHPNGAVRYDIEYEPTMISGNLVTAGSSSSLFFTLTLPSEFQTYNVRVVAVNSQGRTSSSVLVIGCTGPERGTQMCISPHHALVFNCYLSNPAYMLFASQILTLRLVCPMM